MKFLALIQIKDRFLSKKWHSQITGENFQEIETMTFQTKNDISTEKK